MALQFRRLFSSGCFYKDFNNNSRICPTMLQFSAVPVFPSCCCYSTRSFIRRSGSEMQITSSKYLQGVYGNRRNISFCLDKYSRNIPFCSSWKDCCLCSVVSGGNGYMPKFLTNEILCRRSFSAGQKNLQPSVNDNAIVKNVGNGKKMSASQILCRIMKKRNKPLAVSDGVSGTEIVREVVTRSTKAIESEGKVLQDGVAKKRSTEAIKSEGKVLQDGAAKKRSTKGSRNGKGHKIFERESASYINKQPEGVSESCSSPSTVVINGLKKSSSAKKIGLSPVLQSTKSKSASAVTDGINVLNQQLGPLYPPSGKSVVVVESLTKAKVIQNYLGANYEVLASYGHVRDLARRSGSVRPDDNFSLVWEVPSSAWTHLKSIKMALSSTDNLILATDPDREGEAIAWHIIEMLQQQDALNENIKVARVVFHEITESSIKIALQNPRKLDSNLVNAYLARRALDYLIGFSISPLLWRKLPGCQSAGRVQSAALALICDRESEIDQFNPQEYWTLGAEFMGSRSDTFGRSAISSHLTHFNSERVDRLSISSKAEAEAIQNKVNSSKFNVIAVKRSKVKRTSPMPYITSTLQQDSANKLHFSSSYTMKLAQQLYEGIKLSDYESMGLITYMRTDGMHISSEAAADINSFVAERYGVQFASKSVRTYFKKVKNAQEAHESIRPTSIRRLPSTVAGILDEDSLKLYTLIWTKTMACQMESALIDMIQVDIGSKDGDVVLRSVGSRTSFSGYQAVYKDREAGVDASPYEESDSNDATFGALHELKVKDSLSLVKVDLSQHYTKPPSRFSEGALVKTLEELGIGRPSTYASIMKVLQDRSYVTMKNRVLQPEFRGRMVSEFLSHHFSEIANYSFTADMETELDNVSAGTTEWKGLLTSYWSRFIEYCKLASDSHIHQVEKLLEEKFGYILFSSLPNDSRVCPSCEEGTLKFKVSRFGSGYFIGCDQHPKCRYIAGNVFNDEEEITDPEKTELFPHKLLGLSPGTNEKIYLKNGPYGHYVQLGDDKTGRTPKRSSVTEGTDINSLTLEDAIALLRYPINLGNHPDDGHPVILKHSKTGFSIKHRRTICQVHKSVKPETITLATGVKLLRSKNAKQSGRPKGKRKTPPKLEKADAILG